MKDLTILQNETKQLMQKYNLNAKIENRYISLSSEIGELGKEIVKGNKYGSKEFEKTKNFASEIGDVFFDFILLCNVADINLEDAFNQVLEKYETRFLDHGTIGSKKI